MTAGAVFDGMPPAGRIDFGVGQPSADLLPVDLLATASETFLARADPLDLNYGSRSGDERFRIALARFLTAEYGRDVAAAELFLTGGNSQALDFLCGLLTRPGELVLVEEASYFLAFQVFRDHGLEIETVPMDAAGMDLDALAERVRRRRPRWVYTIPSFHNPTGRTLTAKSRARLAQLSLEAGFTVIADEPYQALWYYDPPPPPMAAWVHEGDILSLGSFSKLLAPGLRLGWIQAGEAAIARLRASGVVTSGGSFNHYTSHVVRQALDSGLQAGWLAQLRSAYRERLVAMHTALERHFAGRAHWQRPEGGYFFWLEFEPGLDTARLLSAARQARTGYQPGAACSAVGELGHCLRLSFAHYSPEQIREGVARLATVL